MISRGRKQIIKPALQFQSNILTLSKILFYFLLQHCKKFFSLNWAVTYSEWIICFSLRKYITSKKKQGIPRAELKHSPWADGQQSKQSPSCGCLGHKRYTQPLIIIHLAFSYGGKISKIKDKVEGCLRPGEMQSKLSYLYFVGVARHHTISLW